ncbi:alpha/beta hydrolase [Brevundimonas sp.]|jgi:acetyl esterase|uniref:alpha/beta hydrolase n=1 Tax=Brevundimonas sp. TaxID=1871086 RepID=UPI0037BFEF4A
MAPPVPAQARAVLDRLAALKPTAAEPSSDRIWLADFRAQTAALAGLSEPPDETIHVRHIALPDGLLLRLFEPTRRRPGVLLHMRGGGGIAGTLDGHDAALRGLAAATERVVVAPDYRLAPDAPFPAQLDDGLAALRWLQDQSAARPWVTVAEPVFVSGDSIGGALAAALAQTATTAFLKLSGQVLLYPNTDLRADATWSSRRSHDGKIIALNDLERQIRLYLGATSRDDPRASPFLAPSLEGGVPALVVTCGLDPLCDEGTAYALRLRDAGVATSIDHYPGALHGVLQMSGWTDQTATLLSRLRVWLDRQTAG